MRILHVFLLFYFLCTYSPCTIKYCCRIRGLHQVKEKALKSSYSRTQINTLANSPCTIIITFGKFSKYVSILFAHSPNAQKDLRIQQKEIFTVNFAWWHGQFKKIYWVSYTSIWRTNKIFYYFVILKKMLPCEKKDNSLENEINMKWCPILVNFYLGKISLNPNILSYTGGWGGGGPNSDNWRKSLALFLCSLWVRVYLGRKTTLCRRGILGLNCSFTINFIIFSYNSQSLSRILAIHKPNVLVSDHRLF